MQFLGQMAQFDDGWRSSTEVLLGRDCFSVRLDTRDAFASRSVDVSRHGDRSECEQRLYNQAYLFIVSVHEPCDDIEANLGRRGIADIVNQFFDNIYLTYKKFTFVEPWRCFASTFTVSNRIRLSSCPSFV
jgi:hypothetical protein